MQTLILKIFDSGWAKFKIEDYEKAVSYLTDIPIEILENILIAKEHKVDFTYNFETEGKGDFKVIADESRTYIIEEGYPQCQLDTFDISFEELSKNIIESIKADIKGWSSWDGMDGDDFANRERQILDLIDRIERIN